MAEAKIHPPSRSRIAEARAAGFAPRPLLVGLSSASLALALSLRLLAAPFAAELAGLLRAPLEAGARGDTGRALGLARAALIPLGQRLALCCVMVFALAALGALLAQGVMFALPRGSRRRFDAPGMSVEASCLAALFVLGVGALYFHEALWLTLPALPSFVARVASALALFLSGLAVVDAAFARARFFRALWLTRSELREEQREAYGAPELREARARARQRVAREAP